MRPSARWLLISLRKLARRTGRFPQLVDPRSSVNGLLLTGSPSFRDVVSKSDAAFAGSSSLRRPLHSLRFPAELALFLRAGRHDGHRLEEIGVAILAHVQESVARAADAPNWLRDHHAEEHMEGEPWSTLSVGCLRFHPEASAERFRNSWLPT